MSIPKRPNIYIDPAYQSSGGDQLFLSHLYRYEHAVAKAAVEALECLLAGQKGDQLIMNPDEFIKAVLARINASGWRADE